ncbi:four helix bundle protein [Haloflavibacter putidus]|uniref:Four helix bundle protein n=1 Tax=Haloflavibacter putidus TaxID=2576776 RepID=A0A508A4F4_9FLAO|nr:four helix bundle protein [Haloflavibacter putidus]TQD40752.1 four helix bundle protein [Haloflavibacter putidus]
MRDFNKYEVWKLSHQLTIKIYELTANFPDSEKYQMVSQMRRAAYSIPANFCEGCGRNSDKDFNRFVQISLGSAHELEYFILLSRDLKLFDDKIYNLLTEKVNHIKGKLYNLSKKLIA